MALLTERQRPWWALGGTLSVAVLTISLASASTPQQQPAAAEVDAVQEALLEARSEAPADRSVDRELEMALDPKVELVLAEPAPEPEPTTEPEPEPEPVPEVVGQLWVTEALNVRAGPSVDAERLGTAPWGTQVDVTGAIEGDWSQVLWEGSIAWVHSAFLSETEPQAPAPPTGISSAECSKNPSLEASLQANAAAAYRAVCAAFGSVSSFGGYRAGDSGDHGSGRALDIMVTGEAGWEIARYLQANAAELGVSYVIFEQRIWLRGDALDDWEWMEDRGGATANHWDHVHVSTN